MQQRYYDPIAGRFLSVDPVVTDANTGKGFGLYTYVDNNPYSKIDPDGRDAISRSEARDTKRCEIDANCKIVIASDRRVREFLGHLAWGAIPGTAAYDCITEGCSKFAATLAVVDLAPGAGKVLAKAFKEGVVLLKAEKAVKTSAGYSVAFETVIEKIGAGTRASHFADANGSLIAAMKSDASFAKMMEDLGVSVGRMDRSPANWTWRHVADKPGVMQLVPRPQHQAGSFQSLLHPDGVGGFKVWGVDY